MQTLKFLGAAVAAVVLMAPTTAIASQPLAPSPLIALSMVASPQSQAALCAVGSAGASSVAGAAASGAMQPAPAPGCVLPVPEAAATPLPPQAASAAPFSLSPLLIGIGAIGLGVLLYALLHKDEEEGPPQPVSPA